MAFVALNCKKLLTGEADDTSTFVAKIFYG